MFMKYAMRVLIVVIVVSGIGLLLVGDGTSDGRNDPSFPVPMSDVATMTALEADVSEVAEDNSTEPTAQAGAPSVKGFTMTAYYDDRGVWYSLKEIAVKKGDIVRLKVTNTKGMHDITIDEYGLKKELPLNEEVVVEFVADKAGEFVYYCSKPNHRSRGQWGILRVAE